MAEVVAQLEAIEAWESSAMSLALDATSREGIARLQGLALSNQQKADELAAARASRDQLVDSVRQSFSTWAELEFNKLAAHIATPQIAVAVLPLREIGNEPPVVRLSDRSRYELLAGCELVSFRDPASGHALQLLLCVKRTVTIQFSTGNVPYPRYRK